MPIYSIWTSYSTYPGGQQNVVASWLFMPKEEARGFTEQFGTLMRLVSIVCHCVASSKSSRPIYYTRPDGGMRMGVATQSKYALVGSPYPTQGSRRPINSTPDKPSASGAYSSPASR